MDFPTPSGRLLIVEDDEFNGPYTKQLLTTSGYEAQLVVSAEEALRFLEEHPEPDAILLDVNLPGMGG